MTFPRKLISVIHLRPHYVMVTASGSLLHSSKGKIMPNLKKESSAETVPRDIYILLDHHMEGFILFKSFLLLLCCVYLMISPV